MAVKCFSSAPSLRRTAAYSSSASRRASVVKPVDVLSPIRWRRLAVSRRDREIHMSTALKVSQEDDLLLEGPEPAGNSLDCGVAGIHHVGLLCRSLEKSLDFYQKLLGLKVNEAMPHDKLAYRGAWLWVGPRLIHLMELPNPDPLMGRPEHGGRDRHTCIAIRDVCQLKIIFDKAGIKYTHSRSGRTAIFTRDPDGNTLEFTQVD